MEIIKSGQLWADTIDGFNRNDTLNVVLSKLHLLEGGIEIGAVTAKCDNEIEAVALVTNYGEMAFNNTAIEVVVNGLAVDTFIYSLSIPYLFEARIEIPIAENLQQNNNQITLNLLSVNGQADAILSNNSSSGMTDLNSIFNDVTLIINTDDYPEETSWQIIDMQSNSIVATGFLTIGTQVYTEEICVNYGSCLSLRVLDAAGDGLCCEWGRGDFFLLNQSGDTLAVNDGVFFEEAVEFFCPNGKGCQFTTDIVTINASNETAVDGSITINTTDGLAPFQYSINGGRTFTDDNTFSNLSAGDYVIVVKDASETCFHEETITVEFDGVSSVNDISEQNIRLYPNPTNENIVIELGKNFNASGTVKIDIYNTLGRLISSDSISKFDSESKTVLSLKGQPSGSYFAKCYGEGFEQYFKVVKI